MIPNFKISEDKKILELIEKTPGNFFALNSPQEVIIPARFYKDKRAEFWKIAKTNLESELQPNGTYIIMSGTTRKVKPLISVQKGEKSENQAPVIVMEDRSDIALVKENAELKAKLQYLELQLADLQADLEETEESLEEAPKEETKNPWLALAEQLAPAAGQILAGIAAKYMATPQTPTNYGPQYRTPTGSRHTGANAMESGHAGRNAEFDNNPLQSQGFNSSPDV